jgi:hypothetical protein
MSACGSCTACCHVFAIPDLNKPAGKWCTHCAVGDGCKIYLDRPKKCVEYECGWLQSQQRPGEEWPIELRPDRCRVVFTGTTNPEIFSAITMHGSPDAWRKKPVMRVIDALANAGMCVAVGGPAATEVTLVNKDGERRITMTKPDETGMQWRIMGGHR